MPRPKRDIITVPLSDREAQCLSLYAGNVEPKDIARMLHLSRRSVYSALDKCQVKLDVNTRMSLYLFARMQGMDRAS